MLSSRPLALQTRQSDAPPTNAKQNVAKTPGRALLGRAGLQENLIHNGAMTMLQKGKRVALDTPFQPRTAASKNTVNKQTYTFDVPPTMSRPLGDKTPFINRQNRQFAASPGSGSQKLFKMPIFSLVDQELDDVHALPPSTTRKKLRVPRSASRSFETPITRGDHWNVSDTSIDLGGPSVAEVPEEEVDDFSEPEYMPPTAIERPYEPEIELPDYQSIGERLRSIGYHRESGSIPTYEYNVKVESEDSASWMLNVPPPDDELFLYEPISSTRTTSKTTSQKASTAKSQPPSTIPKRAMSNNAHPIRTRPSSRVKSPSSTTTTTTKKNTRPVSVTTTRPTAPSTSMKSGPTTITRPATTMARLPPTRTMITRSSSSIISTMKKDIKTDTTGRPAPPSSTSSIIVNKTAASARPQSKITAAKTENSLANDNNIIIFKDEELYGSGEEEFRFDV